MGNHKDKFYTGAEPSLDDKYREIYGEKSKGFLNISDFECPCCRISKVEKGFLKLVNSFIRQYGIIDKENIGGYRCAKHNAATGGSKGSAHLKGLAIDIPVKSAREKRKMVRLADRMGFRGIGVYNGHIHLDDMERWHKEKVMWSGVSA